LWKAPRKIDASRKRNTQLRIVPVQLNSLENRREEGVFPLAISFEKSQLLIHSQMLPQMNF
jgi:hypothetical protein